MPVAGGTEPNVAIGTVTLNAAIDKRYLLDGLVDGDMNRVVECTYSAGGKGLNVARVARLIGARVRATGFLGGHAGRYVGQEIARLGIADDFVEVPGETRSCINVYDRVTGRTTELLEPGVEVRPADLEALAGAFGRLVDDVDVVVLSGSVPRGCPSDVYGPLVALAHRAGRPVVVDTSGLLLEQVLAARPTLVKPNVAEASALAGRTVRGTDELVEVGHVVRRRGAERVLLSRGAAGAVLVGPDGVWEAVPPRVAAVNTVGCGDAMVAAAAVALAEHRDPAATLHRAVAVATAAAMSPGTGSFTQEHLDVVVAQGIDLHQLA